MNLFYNKEAVGDVAFLQINPTEGEYNYVTQGDVVEIQNDGEVVGYNIFNASNKATLTGNGHIKLTDKLDADFTPKFVVGYVETKDKHPDADKLSVLSVDVATEKLQIVCGAPNVEAGQKVVVAKVGAVMPSGMVIKDAELRGVASSGMICSMKELGLPNAPQEKGIMVLSDDYTVGQSFFEV